MRLFKNCIILFFISFLLSSCTRGKYKYRITHLDNSVDTILIDDANHSLSLLKEENKLINDCSCSGSGKNLKKNQKTIAINVKDYDYLGVEYKEENPKPETTKPKAKSQNKFYIFLVFVGIGLFATLLYFVDKHEQKHRRNNPQRYRELEKPKEKPKPVIQQQPKRKQKSSFMKSTLKYIFYVGAGILSIKIIMLAVEYIPQLIEKYFKSIL